MKIVIAPDSFKGSLSSLEACRAMERGILHANPNIETVIVPISDGGEGMLDCVFSACQGQRVALTVRYPAGGEGPSEYLLTDGGQTAVIELAKAAGLTMVPPQKRNPLETTTYGVGQLIADAVKRGVKTIYIGIGGSATSDGGAGMLQAMGVRLTDKNGAAIKPGGGHLCEIAAVDASDMISLDGVTVIAACDVKNPLFGPNGAAYVYAPQKGADPETCRLLDDGLRHFAAVAGIDPEVPGSGAAGGVGAALFHFLHARPESGISVAMTLAGFAQKLQGTSFVFTGEGMTDRQTAFGKAVFGICEAAECAGAYTVCLSGGLGEGAAEAFADKKAALFSIVNKPMALEQAIANAADLLEAASEQITRLIVK